ncbi:MAG: hypothetical protein SPJ78_01115 [Corynebacterium camporealensis]|nr:hypothetical protein [Corynebacterium camporealensis]MDY5839312.1 hypothetical protein [Corynebacterium camporealensis]
MNSTTGNVSDDTQQSNEESMESLCEAEAILNNGQHRFDNADEMFEALNI